jgi:hypothetical protein
METLPHIALYSAIFVAGLLIGYFAPAFDPRPERLARRKLADRRALFARIEPHARNRTRPHPPYPPATTSSSKTPT